jgi:hypothetical protein
MCRGRSREGKQRLELALRLHRLELKLVPKPSPNPGRTRLWPDRLHPRREAQGRSAPHQPLAHRRLQPTGKRSLGTRGAIHRGSLPGDGRREKRKTHRSRLGWIPVCGPRLRRRAKSHASGEPRQWSFHQSASHNPLRGRLGSIPGKPGPAPAVDSALAGTSSGPPSDGAARSQSSSSARSRWRACDGAAFANALECAGPDLLDAHPRWG